MRRVLSTLIFLSLFIQSSFGIINLIARMLESLTSLKSLRQLVYPRQRQLASPISYTNPNIQNDVNYCYNQCLNLCWEQQDCLFACFTNCNIGTYIV